MPLAFSVRYPWMIHGHHMALVFVLAISCIYRDLCLFLLIATNYSIIKYIKHWITLWYIPLCLDFYLLSSVLPTNNNKNVLVTTCELIFLYTVAGVFLRRIHRGGTARLWSRLSFNFIRYAIFSLQRRCTNLHSYSQFMSIISPKSLSILDIVTL